MWDHYPPPQNRYNKTSKYNTISKTTVTNTLRTYHTGEHKIRNLTYSIEAKLSIDPWNNTE